ncbi:MAG TPA: hypothetical protein VHY79_06920 [Rhizomicrobium sp.]|jgi:hypothetical protein|nr:hypothetical protein [Rhizomicrobium sp.]
MAVVSDYQTQDYLMTEPEGKTAGSLNAQALWEKYEDIAMHFMICLCDSGRKASLE